MVRDTGREKKETSEEVKYLGNEFKNTGCLTLKLCQRIKIIRHVARKLINAPLKKKRLRRKGYV